jgi:hypothetical protein
MLAAVAKTTRVFCMTQLLQLTYATAADRNREALDPSRFQGPLLKKADDRQPLTSPRISGGAMSRADTVGVGVV